MEVNAYTEKAVILLATLTTEAESSHLFLLDMHLIKVCIPVSLWEWDQGLALKILALFLDDRDHNGMIKLIIAASI